MKYTGIAIASILLLGGLFWTSCSEDAPAGPAICEDCNVIFMLVDTLRADHLGVYGYERPTSPTLDALAEGGLTFLNAASQSSCTFPSVNSLLTSQYTFPFLDPETRPAVPDHIPYLPDILAANGYTTAGISASPIVRAKPGKFNPVGGFGRGFERFDDSCEWRRADCVHRLALEELDRQSDKPFFLYLHYIDVHDPYNPPPTIRGTFSSPYEGDHEFVEQGDPNPIQKLIREGQADALLTADDFQHLVDLYDEEILLFDGFLKNFLDELEKRGLREKTILVITSDHGEEFYEHQLVKHCGSVYDTETHVPLIFDIPVVTQPARVPYNVENTDVVPTLLDYLGIAVDPSWDLQGQSLRTLIEGGTRTEERFSYTAMGVHRGINDDRYKLIQNLGTSTYRLYDSENDPEQQNNVLETERRVFRQLQDRLHEWSREHEGDEEVDDRLKKAKEVEEQLRSLGYLG